MIVVTAARHFSSLFVEVISQNGKDIRRPVGFSPANAPSLVPSTVNWAMTISPASMYSGLVMWASEKPFAQASVHSLNWSRVFSVRLRLWSV